MTNPDLNLYDARGNEGALTHLTATQQEQLFDWLELHSASVVLKKVAAPVPEGFGIRTHLTTLRQFHKRARARFREEMAAENNGMAAMQPGSSSEIDQRTLEAARHSALELATLHQNTPTHFSALARWILRLQANQQRDRELKILEARLALEKMKFEFNAARAALIHAAELKPLITDDHKDNEEKIWAAREQIFGPRSALIENFEAPESIAPGDRLRPVPGAV